MIILKDSRNLSPKAFVFGLVVALLLVLGYNGAVALSNSRPPVGGRVMGLEYTRQRTNPLMKDLPVPYTSPLPVIDRPHHDLWDPLPLPARLPELRASDYM